MLEQLHSAEAFVRRNIASGYPIEVVREAVVNALIHRDYYIGWIEIHVTIHPDRIEVSNPGRISFKSTFLAAL